MDKLKIVIKNENERVYTPEYGVPTIHLGDGLTLVSNIASDEGFHGISFTEDISDGAVGAQINSENGKTVEEIGSYLQIVTKNPDSIDVLIKNLQIAKNALIKAYVEPIEASVDVDLRNGSLDDLQAYLEAHEQDIAMKINDFDNLAGLFFDVMDRDAKQ